jgi:ketosteroid isomerase-like protein
MLDRLDWLGHAKVACSPTPSGTEQPMPEERKSDDDLAELIGLMSEAASAFIGGRMRRYFDLMRHTDDFTLMPPTGGDTIHGSSETDESIDEMARFFKRGEATLEVIQTYASGDLAVLVVVERQYGEVGDYPTQDWSLRVTLVFRRDGSQWRLAHRHADALVHPITFDQLAVLARGSDDGGARSDRPDERSELAD